MATATAGIRFKILLLGDIDVGKTSLILRCADGTFTDDLHAEIDRKDKTYDIGGSPVRLMFIDTAGQERFQTLTCSFFRNADALVGCFAVNNKESAESVTGHFGEALRYSPKALKYLSATKQDLSERWCTEDQSQELADTIGARLFNTSAKTGEGVDELFRAIAQDLLQLSPRGAVEGAVTLSSSKPAKKGFCTI